MKTLLDYPEDLPISQHRDEIIAAVRTNPVVIVCGDTGSGKTTQLPKMMLELGRAKNGRRIAVTQPRRLAAVTMAERVEQEIAASPAGREHFPNCVGYHHRYAKKLSSETRIEFLTDGVLLAETKFDPLLRMYDTIIVDEAHERSLNVDFLLGILKRILQKRRDLRVIIASATMDTQKFAAFFAAPVLQIPGRLFPIELRYRPADEETEDLPHAVATAVQELPSAGDILVFLSGERDIRETAEHLQGVRGATDEIIPLLASLPASEQRRAFTLSTRRRIILATNVAETSVTIPGIRAVIDSGVARISRYIHRTQIQRLQIEPISQASARQRAGRCGRLGPGICIRLYSEEDFAKREEYTSPEVLRSSLAGVILTMLDLRLGAIEDFPFVDPPREAMVREGLKELLELGAITHHDEPDGTRRVVLTEIGRKLARIPVEPRLARMLLTASDNAVLPSVLPLVSAMACDDPRRRPIDERDKATQAHAQWRVEGSDFLGTLKLWTSWHAETHALSQSKARKLAQKYYLSWPKLREWNELTHQLEQLSKRLGLSFAEIPPGETRDAAIHLSLLSGLLGRIGHWHAEDGAYRGAHALRFALHPSSVLSRGRARKNPPEWIVAGELVDTARLFAREAAVIDPNWIEALAKDIVKCHVHSPFWDAESGFVRATEQVTLYGLVIVEARRCDYARFNPEGAREIFLRRGLLDAEFPRPTPVIRTALNFLRDLRALAEKARTPDFFDEDRLLAHFVAALPKEITNANALRKYLAHASADEIRRFSLVREDWWPKERPEQTDFPNAIVLEGKRLPLTYRHTPDEPEVDGVTCTVRLSDIPLLSRWHSDWLVPGLLRKKVNYLLLCLPNSIQRLLRPLDESLILIMDLLKASDEPLTDALRRVIYDRWSFRIPIDAWDHVKIPPYLQMRFIVRDETNGRHLLVSRDKKAVLALAEKTSTPRPPAQKEHDLLSLVQKLPFASPGKFPLAFSLFLTEIGTTEEEARRDIREGALRASLTEDGHALRSETDFIRNEREVYQLVLASVAEMKRLEKLLTTGEYSSETTDDILEQLAWLTFKGFPRLVPLEILRRYPRYLKGIEIRLQRARLSPSADRAKLARVAPFWQRYREALKNPRAFDKAQLSRCRWLIEELRLQTFAQELKTFETVSPKRLDAAFASALKCAARVARECSWT